MVDQIESSGNIEKSQKGDMRFIDSKVDVGEKRWEMMGFIGMVVSETGLPGREKDRLFEVG